MCYKRESEENLATKTENNVTTEARWDFAGSKDERKAH